MLREVLEGAGHRVTEAVDRPQALERATAGAFNVALIDIGLPGFDGREVARRLRGMRPRLATTLLVQSRATAHRRTAPAAALPASTCTWSNRRRSRPARPGAAPAAASRGARTT